MWALLQDLASWNSLANGIQSCFFPLEQLGRVSSMGETVPQIPHTHAIKGFKGDDHHLELGLEAKQQPMQLAQQWCLSCTQERVQLAHNMKLPKSSPRHDCHLQHIQFGKLFCSVFIDESIWGQSIRRKKNFKISVARGRFWNFLIK